MDLLKIFRAGFVHRWHTNPDLAHTNDRIDGHSARVARIILALHPDPSVDLLRAALIHDDGESVVGDIPAPFKNSMGGHHVSAEAEAALDLWGGRDVSVSADDRRWLKFADRLDAYMWAAHHAPYVLTGDGWPEARRDLRAMAEYLGAEAGMDAIIDMEVRHATP